MARSRIRSYRPPDVWPGYVDALTTLLLSITFLLTVYVLAQFFLSQTLSGREKALERLRQDVAALSQQLAGERKAKQDAEAQAAGLTASLQSATETREVAEKRAAGLQEDIDRLNTQLAQIAAALEASEAKARADQVAIADLGQRLQVALAEKVAEMARYRSEFFGRLREVLGDRPDIRVVGDRFVFQSEVLFPSGSADLSPEGRKTLTAFARTLIEIANKITPDVSWVLRVDGHTDRVPISSARFPSNWELSTGRALSVVKFLTSQGVPPQRLAATGFGEFQPLDDGTGPAANARNRRIEMRLTDR
ncbi:MAG: peptidoglycan -binding protein [Deltaproteobacteria bacterium]|nr:peptidoglycan -binding protein [Deltaproteobacteria bacterium]